MNEKAIAFYNRLIEDYIDICAKEKKETDKLIKSLWRDRRTKIEKVFSKTFKKPIDKCHKI